MRSAAIEILRAAMSGEMMPQRRALCRCCYVIAPTRALRVMSFSFHADIMKFYDTRSERHKTAFHAHCYFYSLPEDAAIRPPPTTLFSRHHHCFCQRY